MDNRVRERPRVDWLELFFDLVFVVGIRQLTSRLHDDPALPDFVTAVLLLAALWACWINVTLLTNTDGEVAPRLRPLVLVSMAGVGLMAIGVPAAESDGAVVFVLGYCVARVAVWPLWNRARGRRGPLGPVIFGPVIALGWLLSLLVPGEFRLWVWAGLIAVEFSFLIVGLPHTAQDPKHMIERVGLFVLIVLGESITELIITADSKQGTSGWIVTALSFATVCALWWIYIEVGSRRLEFAGSRLTGTSFRDLLVGAHFVFVLSFTLIAAGLGGAIEHADDHRLLPGTVTSLAVGAVLFYVAVLWVDVSSIRTGRSVVAIVVVVPGVLTAASVLVLGTGWPPWLVVAVTLASVIAYPAIIVRRPPTTSRGVSSHRQVSTFLRVINGSTRGDRAAAARRRAGRTVT